MQEWILKPGHAHGRIELCGMDLGLLMHMPYVFFFDDTLDPDRLRRAVATALDSYPVYAGKVVKESGRLWIDLDGHGVKFEYAESDGLPPRYGPDVFPVAADGLLPNLPRQVDHTQTSLLMIKLTRFADGSFAFGAYASHLAGDGSSTMFFYDDVGKCYRGETTVAPVFTRTALVANGDANATEPSTVWGLVKGAPSPNAKRSQTEQDFGSFVMSAEERARLSRLTATFKKRTSINKLLHALMFRAHALSHQGTDEILRANLHMDVRYLKGIHMPRKYCGNAFLHRTLSFTRDEATQSSWEHLCERFGDPDIYDPKLVARDIGFRQRCYEQGQYDDRCALSDYTFLVSDGSLFINNLSHLSRHAFTIGGLASWSGAVFTDYPRARMCKAAPMELDGTVRVELILPTEQLGRYQERWRECVEGIRP